MRALTTLTTLLWCLSFGPASADHEPPPVPEGGLMVVQQGECTEIETGIEGYCVLSQDRQGNFYAIMSVDGEVWFIRQIVGNSYVELYHGHDGELL